MPPPVATFLLTRETEAEAIIAHARRCRTNTLQLVDRVGPGGLPALRRALPGIKLVQVVHVAGEEPLAEAVAAAAHADALLLDSGKPHPAVKELGGTGRVHDWAMSRRIVEAARARCSSPAACAPRTWPGDRGGAALRGRPVQRRPPGRLAWTRPSSRRSSPRSPRPDARSKSASSPSPSVLGHRSGRHARFGTRGGPRVHTSNRGRAGAAEVRVKPRLFGGVSSRSNACVLARSGRNRARRDINRKVAFWWLTLLSMVHSTLACIPAPGRRGRAADSGPQDLSSSDTGRRADGERKADRTALGRAGHDED